MSAGEVPVQWRELVVRYGSLVAVDGLTLDARQGEVLAILGPNGAGKTTTVETAEGYRRPDSGQVRVLGLDPVSDRRRLTPRLGVMLQDGGVYPSMGPGQALGLFAAYYDNPRDPGELLELVDLKSVAKTSWRRLSGGEKQRLSLALALVGRPEVVFLDEPTAGVDPRGRLAVRSVIEGLKADGVCVVLTTHELPEAERLADRIAIVRRGQVVAVGTLAELAASEGPETVRFDAPAALDVGALAGVLGLVPGAVAETTPGSYRIGEPATPALLAALTGWLADKDLALSDLRTGHPGLEDIYLRLTQEDGA